MTNLGDACWIGGCPIHTAHAGIKIGLREAGGRRSAGRGHDRSPQFDRIILLNIDTRDGDYVTVTHGVLVRCTACKPLEWPSESPPAAQATGIAPLTCVPLAIASADHFFGQPTPAWRARRDDGGLEAACVKRTVRHRQPQEARSRAMRMLRV